MVHLAGFDNKREWAAKLVQELKAEQWKEIYYGQERKNSWSLDGKISGCRPY